MDEIVKILPNFKKFNSYIDDVKNFTSPMMLSGLTDTGKIHFAYATHFYTEKPICIITYNELQAKSLIKDLSYFTNNIEYFPKREIVTYDYLAESKEIQNKRISCLNNIYEKKAKVIVTTIEAMEQRIISKESLYKNILSMKTGVTVNLEELKKSLTALGYERMELTESISSYSIRGGIIDIAISETLGVRIELWGDVIDSIRHFDIATQRSKDKVSQIKIYPATEFILEKDIEEIIKNISEDLENDIVSEDIEAIKNGNYLSKVDKYFNDFYETSETLIDYIKDNYIIFLDEVSKLKARSENIIKDNKNLIKSLIEKKRPVPQSLKIQGDFIKFLESIKQIQTVYLEKQDIGFIDKQTMHAKRNGYSFSYREVNFFRSSMDLLFQEVQKAVKSKKTIIILTGSKDNTKKIMDMLSEKNIIASPNDVIISEKSISSGFECYDFNLLVISVSEVFKVHSKKRVVSSEFKQGETIIFADLKVGDYIVHKTNGIGQFVGVDTIKADGIIKDYIKVRYKDDDMLYIPTSSLDNIRKYIGTDSRMPKVNRLGSKEWENTKQRVKSNLKEIAKDLIELYSIREKIKGYKFSADTPWQKEFDDGFNYVETDDQLRAIKEMKHDMEHDKPMDRLLCRRCSGMGRLKLQLEEHLRRVWTKNRSAI